MSLGKQTKIEALRLRRPCPECGKPSQRETYPFCSPRCKTIDLGRWLTGSYVIPASEEEPSDADPRPGEAADRREGDD